ncbi:MAG: metal-dependent transcriptional regulator [Flavobacteriales bacterium]
MNSLAVENYLKALFALSNETGEVNVSELSERLNIKMPTVTSMMKKLAAKGLVHYESYKPLKLTEEGAKQAALIIRKHRLTEMYLVEKMGFGWDEVHNIAEQIEHIDAPKFFDKMDALLGFPKIDPHGSPIPDKQGKVVWKELSRLSDCLIGDQVQLEAVTNASDDFLRFLNSRNVNLGLVFLVKAKELFDDSMTLSYLDHTHEIFSSKVCERLLVKKLSH